MVIQYHRRLRRLHQRHINTKHQTPKTAPARISMHPQALADNVAAASARLTRIATVVLSHIASKRVSIWASATITRHLAICSISMRKEVIARKGGHSKPPGLLKTKKHAFLHTLGHLVGAVPIKSEMHTKAGNSIAAQVVIYSPRYGSSNCREPACGGGTGRFTCVSVPSTLEDLPQRI